MKTEIKIKTIKDIISLKKENVLRVNEEYQRADNLWSKRQKIFLIDSIMREYPIPFFYFHIRSKEAAGYGGTLPDIIDGQQRVDTIYEFSNDDFKLMDPKKSSGIPRFLGQKECPWVGKKFSEFNPELREQFLKTKLNIVEIQTNDENEVNKFSILKSKIGYGGSIIARSFFKSCGIDPQKYHGRYDWKKENIEGVGEVYIIELKRKIEQNNIKYKKHELPVKARSCFTEEDKHNYLIALPIFLYINTLIF